MAGTRKLPREKAKEYSKNMRDAEVVLERLEHISQHLQLARPRAPNLTPEQQREISGKLDEVINHLKEAQRAINADTES